MHNIIDIHTHRQPPQPGAVVSVDLARNLNPVLLPGQAYSVGFHPWNIKGAGLSAEQLRVLEYLLALPEVLMAGECGVDMTRLDSVPLFVQLTVLRQHIEASENACKPLLLHCVRGHQEVIALHKAMKPRMPWVVHGFRGKPTILKLFLGQGIAVSYGQYFNPQSVAATPVDMLYAETDESAMPIDEIIRGLSQFNSGVSPSTIAENIERLTLC